MKHYISGLWEGLNRVWCRWVHPMPMWPVNGQYRCPECLRTYKVMWAEPLVHPHAMETRELSAHGRRMAVVGKQSLNTAS